MKYVILLMLLVFSTSSSNASYHTANTSVISKYGNCACKRHCDQWAHQGQYTPAGLSVCKKNCQEKFAGCNAGSYYGGSYKN